MDKQTFFLKSSDGRSRLSAFLFVPDAPVRGVVQISHGMCEYLMRYTGMAEILTAHGFAVCGCDHLGHGSTAELNHSALGYFGEKGSWYNLVEDQEQVYQAVRVRYPGLPYFMLGHSMGSFIARLYAARYGQHLNGLILSGTAGRNPAAGAGRLLIEFVILLKGGMYRSPLLYRLTTGGYNKGLHDGTSVDWLCHDKDICTRYLKDRWCSYTFTAAGYRELLELITRCNDNEWYRSFPRDLPLLLYSGDADPVGDCGAGVRQVYSGLKEAGVRDINLILYPGGRHEMHNEAAKDEVYQNILLFLEKHLPTNRES